MSKNMKASAFSCGDSVVASQPIGNGVLGLELPRGIPYAYTVESDVPIVVQHSRLDTSGGYTLFTSIAYGE